MSRSIEIKINESSRVPKYKQIVDSICNDISNGKIKIGTKLPSINGLSESSYLSRATVEKAYRHLKERKVIIAVKGKGFYITKTDLIAKINILFLINKPSSYKMIIYDSFVSTVGTNGHVNMFIYHCEESLFLRILERSLGGFDYYLIMPHFKSDALTHVNFTDPVLEIIEKIPKEKLIIIDNDQIHIKGNYASVYQDFKNDIFNALKEGIHKLKKYERVILVYPKVSIYPYPKRIVYGFQKFCSENNLDFEILDEVYSDMELNSKDAYIIVEETDLVNLIRQIRRKKLRLGREIGIVSYNDTPLKELLGITVISTDFKAMGEIAANFVLKNKKGKIKNEFKYIERHSV